MRDERWEFFSLVTQDPKRTPSAAVAAPAIEVPAWFTPIIEKLYCVRIVILSLSLLLSLSLSLSYSLSLIPNYWFHGCPRFCRFLPFLLLVLTWTRRADSRSDEEEEEGGGGPSDRNSPFISQRKCWKQVGNFFSSSLSWPEVMWRKLERGRRRQGNQSVLYCEEKSESVAPFISLHKNSITTTGKEEDETWDPGKRWTDEFLFLLLRLPSQFEEDTL